MRKNNDTGKSTTGKLGSLTAFISFSIIEVSSYLLLGNDIRNGNVLFCPWQCCVRGSSEGDDGALGEKRLFQLLIRQIGLIVYQASFQL